MDDDILFVLYGQLFHICGPSLTLGPDVCSMRQLVRTVQIDEIFLVAKLRVF
jgi:hypothetical protein